MIWSDSHATLELIARGIGLIAIVHGFEFLYLRARIEAIWRWSDLESELGSVLRFPLSAIGFQVLNVIRIASGVMAVFYPNGICLVVLLVIHVLTLLRWLGTFNGGSDYMYLLLLWSCALGLTFPAELGRLVLYYVSFQLCLSYVKAGWVKITKREWRSGEALGHFLMSPQYMRTRWVESFANSKWLVFLAAWVVMLFELSFPLGLGHAGIAILYMVCGCVFHLINAYVFGLNRFFLTWVVAYPALYFTCTS